MPTGSLSGIEWSGSAEYKSLSYFFAVRWNFERGGDYVGYVFEPFEITSHQSIALDPPTPGFPPVYSLVQRRRSQSGRYKLFYGPNELTSSDDVRDVFTYLAHHVNVETMRRTGDFLLLHAGAVASPSGAGVLLPAESGSGKTSLTAALVIAGFGYLSDEAAAIDPVSRRIYPYAKPLHLKAGVLDRFEGAVSRSREIIVGAWDVQVRPDDLRPGCVAEPCHPAYVVFPRYTKGAAIDVRQISPAEAVSALGRNAWNLHFYGRRGLELLAELSRKVTAWELAFGDLEDAVAAVAELCQPSGANGIAPPAGE